MKVYIGDKEYFLDEEHFGGFLNDEENPINNITEKEILDILEGRDLDFEKAYYSSPCSKCDSGEKNKLKAEKIEETSKTIKEGIVISQETDANITANAGDTVKIHVSIGTGVNQVVMPNVLGKTEADAKSALEAKNLVVKVEYKENTDKEHRRRCVHNKSRVIYTRKSL